MFNLWLVESAGVEPADTEGPLSTVFPPFSCTLFQCDYATAPKEAWSLYPLSLNLGYPQLLCDQDQVEYRGPDHVQLS